MNVESELAAAGFDLAQPFDARELDPARPRGLLVGNTRALWARFVAARAADPKLDASRDPLERYTEQTIDRVAARLADARVLYGHRRYGGAFVPLQRLAVTAGLGTLSPTHFVIHPIYGPWFALRAVILAPGVPEQRPGPAAACTCSERCHDALAAALAATGPQRWRAWLAVRDACPVGRAYRYEDAQIVYHYSFLG